MIDLSSYTLSVAERDSIAALLSQTGSDLKLEQLYSIMDMVWSDLGCDPIRYDADKYAAFYRHPVWLLNGIFIEQHEESLSHRHTIAKAICNAGAKYVLDFGGGFGTLARLLADSDQKCTVDIWDPFPPRHGLVACRPYANIRFISTASDNTYDALACTDVLEHVHDPILLLSEMVNKVKLGGILVIYNCFFRVIQCHLPSTFHLRDTFDEFCGMLGLRVDGMTTDDHATIYRKDRLVRPEWKNIRAYEQESIRSYAMREWRYQNPHASLLRYRIKLGLSNPLYYPRRVIDRLAQPLARLPSQLHR